MKATRCFYICFVLSLLAGAISAKAQGTAFTYQGRLTESSGPAEGWYDFRFEIYNAETGGSPLAGPVTGTYVASNGLFTATLDFGTNIFDGGPRWVEISVRTNDASNAYTTLVPRQRITAAPYAMTAGTVTGPIPSDSFSGTFSNAVRLNNRSNEFTGRFEGDGAGLSNVTVTLPASVAHVNSNQLFSGVNQFQNGANVFAGSFIGDGVRVENVDAARLNGFAVTHFWQTGGNGETDPRTNFLGTTDRQALELRVNNERGLRIEPTRSNDTVNVLGGSGQNQIAADVISATIAGGGTPLFGGGARPNIAESDFATISGGAGNRIAVDSPKATIGGGFGQSIGSNTPDGTIAGGHSHVISSNSSGATISGGGANTIGAGGTGATISGGWENTVRGQAAVVGGGNGNSIGTNSWNAVIGGGYVNAIDPDAGSATIGGGGLNVIKRSFYATIGGGWQNVTHGDASGILSGFNNTIETNTWTSVIGGGYQNTIRRDAGQAVIGGGFLNRIRGIKFGDWRRPEPGRSGRRDDRWRLAKHNWAERGQRDDWRGKRKYYRDKRNLRHDPGRYCERGRRSVQLCRGPGGPGAALWRVRMERRGVTCLSVDGQQPIPGASFRWRGDRNEQSAERVARGGHCDGDRV